MDGHFENAMRPIPCIDVIAPLDPYGAEIDGTAEEAVTARKSAPPANLPRRTGHSPLFPDQWRDIEFLRQAGERNCSTLWSCRGRQVEGEWFERIDPARERILGLVEKVDERHLTVVPHIIFHKRHELAGHAPERLETLPNGRENTLR